MSNVTKKVVPNRAQEAVKVSAPGRVQQARKAGPIGAQTDSQGNNNAEPKKHPKTDGGKSGLGGKL